jgi:hypothetical protein
MNTLGKLFALCTADEQGEFLNAAGRNLRRACVDGDEDMQLMRIVDRLDGTGRELVKRLADFVRADEEAPHVVHRVVYQDEVVPRSAEPEPETP